MFENGFKLFSRTKVIDSNNQNNNTELSLLINTYSFLIMVPLILVAISTYINFIEKKFSLDEVIIDLKLSLMFSGIIYTFLSTLIYRVVHLLEDNKIKAEGFLASRYFKKLPLVDKLEVLVYTVLSGIMFFISPLLGLFYLIFTIRVFSFDYNIQNYFTFLKVKVKTIIKLLSQSIILLLTTTISIIYGSVLYKYILSKKIQINNILKLGEPNNYIYILYILTFIFILLLAINLIFILITSFTYNIRYAVDMIEHNKKKGVQENER